MEFTPEKEHKYITDDSVAEITRYDKCQRQLYILRIKNTGKFAVAITYVHQHKRIKPKKFAKKYVAEKTAEKSDYQAFLFPSHKSEGRCEYYHKIGNNTRKGKSAEHTALQYKADNYK
jgi:hypothetical protein